MPPESDGSSSGTGTGSKRETFTVAVQLEKLLKDKAHVEKCRDVAQRAHEMTRLASRLLNFHIRKCLERDLPLPRVGYATWVYNAWHDVSHVKTPAKNRKPDEELARTLAEFMANVKLVDATKLSHTKQFEAERWASTASTNIYRHFPKRVATFVRTEHKLSPDDFKAMSSKQKLSRKTQLAKVAKDLCSDPALALTCPEEFHEFVKTTREKWRLTAFPWQMFPGMPLAYHQAANEKTKPDKCNAHLLLPAMHHMLLARERHHQRAFALLPLRTSLVPAHTQFGEMMIRPVLGLGPSRARKEQKNESAKRRKLEKAAEAQRAAAEASSDDDIDFVPLSGGAHNDTADSVTTEGSAGSSGASPAPAVAAAKKRKTPERRPKAQVAEERRAELAGVFDLKAAGVHDCKDKRFECTFTTDGYAAHLQFSRPASKALGPEEFPLRGVHDIDDLARRLKHAKAANTPDAKASRDAVNAIKAPEKKLEKLCISCDCQFCSPFEEFICVGCDPGKNEPAVIADPSTGRTMRMTAAARRHATQPGNWIDSKRHRLQAERKGRLPEYACRCADAAAYRQNFVDKPTYINTLESELGQDGRSANAATLSGFGAYVAALTTREAVLVPHYEQIHHRKLRFKAHIERQRFEDRFIRDIRRKFDPEHTKKTIVICWGQWGRIAGRPNTVGNKGLPPTIGVKLARRVAKKKGIVVAWTPEHHTTATHFRCGGKCERFTTAEQKRAKDLGFRHSVKQIRGLKRCTNPACLRPVNRDLNAALNIGVNGMLLLTGHQPIAKHSADEVELLNIENEMQGAEWI
jgi:hypothetical protein